MAINFPANPTPNDVFTDGGKSWIWDGVTWKIYSSSTTGIGLGDLSVTTLSVGTAALSYNQSTGVFSYTPPDLSGYITQQYTLPTASTTVLGGVKIDGTTITINNGVISGASQGASVSVSDVAPTNPNQGDLWWRSSEGRLKIRYEDGNSNQWVDAFPVLDGSTSIAVADESTDTECFPLFSTVATGDLEPKTVNSFKLNSSSGQLEAGSFKKSGGSSSEFLKADGSIDSTSYSTFSGSYTDLTNKPTLVSNLNDLGDVNTTGAANGKILKYDLSTTSWIVADDLNSGGSGGGSSDPVGTIVAWSGGSNSLPTGYQLCDGTTPVTTELQLVVGVGNTVPDLRDRFIIGAGNNYNVDATGGSKDAVVVEHKHTTNIDGGHVIPGNGGSTFGYGGAGTYSSTIFNMQNEGVSGTDQNLPPYYALCYVIKHTSATSLSNTFIGLNDTPISHSNGKILQSNGSSLIWIDLPTGFSGNYNDLTNKPTLFSGSYNDLSNKPTLFSGSYNDLSNKPTIPSTLNDLSDVDTTGVANGKIIKYNGSSWVIADDASGGASPGGSDTHVQFNSSGSFSGDASLTWDNTNNKFKIGNADSDSYLLVGNNSKRAELRNNNSSTYLYSYADSTFHIAQAGSGNNIQLDWVSGTMARFKKQAECALYYNNELRFETTSDGAKIEGDIRLRRNASDDGALYFGDTNDNYIFGSDTDDVLTFATNGGEKFRIGSSGQIGLSGANYGTSGQVLTSNGTNSAPTWQTVSGGGGSGGGNVAVGSIMIWSGATNQIPTGWQLCDGTNGSPDLRDKFVIGAGNNYNVDDTGGSTTETVNISGSDTVNISASDNVTISGTTGTVQQTGGSAYTSMYSQANHTHSFSGSATVNITASDTVNISGSDTVNTLPPYYALCYIYCTTAGSNQTFVGLDDTPSSFTADKWLKVNSGGTALEWADAPSGFSGNYNDLTNKPTLFSGAYNDLTGKPTLVTTLGQLTDINITGSPADDSILQYNSSTSEWDVVSGSGIGFSGNYNDLTNKPTIPAAQVNSNWNANSGITQILNKPNLATVATSGNYNDLINRPNITLPSTASRILYNNASGVTTTSANLKFTASTNNNGVATEEINGTWLTMRFQQNNPLRFGQTGGGVTEAPLEIYSDGANGVIHKRSVNTGHLRILCGNLAAGRSRTISIVNEDHATTVGNIPTTGQMAEFQSDGGQKLFWQGSGTKGSRLETTEYGILLKRTDTSLEGGHIQFEDVQGNSRFAIDVYGTTTANSLLRIIDQQSNQQRYCVNGDGAFGIGHVGNEDYGAAGEVLISQGSSSLPVWGTVSGGSNAVGIGLSGQSLGSSAGNQLVLAQIQASVSNASYLQFKKVRDTNGTSWDQAYTRIQQRIDVTDQGYIQFNGSDNTYGMEFGTSGDKKFARFVDNGSAELYYNGNEKFKTTNTGITVTGSVSTQDINMSNLNGDANEVDNTKGSWSIQEGSDDLFIINRVTGKKYKFNLTEIE